MAVATCTNHPDIGAIGKCFRCERPYCLDCLDIESGHPLCKSCLPNKTVSTTQTPSSVVSPIARFPVGVPVPSKIEKDTFISLDDLNMEVKVSSDRSEVDVHPIVEEPSIAQFVEEAQPVVEKPTSVDLPALKLTENDPLGLFKSEVASAKPKPEPPQRVDPDPLGLFKNPSTQPVITSVPSKIGDEVPAALSQKDISPDSPARPSDGLNPFVVLSPPTLGEPKSMEKTNISQIPQSLDKPAPMAPLDLAGGVKKVDGAEQAANKSAELKPRPPVRNEGKISIRDLHAPSQPWFHSFRYVMGDLWLKVELIASKFRIPGYLLVAIILVLVAGGITLVSQLNAPPAITVVDSIPAIDIIPTDVSQISDLDITAFSDLQNQLGDLGFSQITQMTIPQLPGPNFFDVGLNPDGNTYSEILKMPSQIGPRVSFVTVFTNGVWYSTNGWNGTNQQMDYLVSEFYPDKTPAQLYNQHTQGIQKLQAANDWQIQKASLNRYMSDLSDHLRWYLTLKKITPDQATFASWH